MANNIIAADPGLVAVYERSDGSTYTTPVLAWGADGCAMVADLSCGCLRAVSILGQGAFKGLSRVADMGHGVK